MKGVKTIKRSWQEEASYIRKRKTGEITSMHTPWRSLDAAGIEGLEWGTINSVGGMSGSGKTAFASQMITEVHKCNPGDDICVLMFTIEMASRKLVGRIISGQMQKSVRHLYTEISDEEMKYIEDVLEPEITQYDINFIEVARTPKGTRAQLEEFFELNKHKKILVVYDHSLLVRRAPSYGERDTLIQLLSQFNELKKVYPYTQYLVISQLNREIEDTKRISDNRLHYPLKKDMFGSDATFQFSDIVFILHNPYDSLGIREYGPNKFKAKGMVFGHVIKARDGQRNRMIFFYNNFKHNKLTELTNMELFNAGIIKSLPPVKKVKRKFLIGLHSNP